MEELGIDTVPVIVGPVSFLLLGKSADGVPEDFDRLSLLEPLLEVYGEVHRAARRAGRDLGAARRALLRRGPLRARARRAAARLRGARQGSTSAPGSASRPTSTTSATPTAVLRDLPIEGVGLDFHRGERTWRGHGARGPKNVELIADEGGLEDKWLFAGIVDGRNVWINELEHSLDLLGGLRDRCAELVVSTSCSLLHTPLDLDAEPPSEVLDDELRSWMAFAKQKVGEVVTLARGLGEGREAIAAELDANDRALEDRRELAPHAQPRGARAGRARSTDADARRDSPFEVRREAQRARLDLPLFPTTTIGSYPQTAEIRQARAELRAGQDRRGRVRAPHALRGRARDPLPGGGRPRRARPRRARAQRHGPVLRRADGGLRLHPERLGAVLRLALRAPADPLRRRQPPAPDDHRLDRLRAVAHRASRSRGCSPAR